jgi:Domain of unknown function (DUF4129)
MCNSLRRLALLLILLSAGAAHCALGQSAGAAAPAYNVPAVTQEISLREYISALDRCSQTLDRLNPNGAAPGGSAPNGVATNAEALRAFRATLPPQWKVRSGNVTYFVDTTWLADALAGIATGPAAQQQYRIAATKQRLAALRESAQALDAENPNDATRQAEQQRARTKIEAILRAKEFQGATGPSWFDQLKSRFYAWLGRQWDKLHLAHGQAIGNTVAWIVIALAVLLVALWAVRNFVAGRAPEIDLRDAQAPGRDWRYWLREARGAAERGDYRAAIHAAYWAGVARLEEANLLPEDRSRTPRESLRLVGRESLEYAPLAALTRSFELVWYGYRAATETDWNNAKQQLEQLESAHIPRPA